MASEAKELKDINDAKAKFGTPVEKWTPIEVDAQAGQRQGKAVKEGIENSPLFREVFLNSFYIELLIYKE